jgi:hypothetical protein
MAWRHALAGCIMVRVDERWLPVIGFEGRYEVSDLGRVRAIFTQKRVPPPPRYVGAVEPSGYVGLWLIDTTRRVRTRAHTLVLQAFVGTCPAGMECRHLNGDKADNRLSNLRWGSPLENMRDQDVHGTRVRGERHGSAKLTEEIVAQIRESTGMQSSTAKMFGVDPSVVSRIKSGKAWAS